MNTNNNNITMENIEDKFEEGMNSLIISKKGHPNFLIIEKLVSNLFLDIGMHSPSSKIKKSLILLNPIPIRDDGMLIIPMGGKLSTCAGEREISHRIIKKASMVSCSVSNLSVDEFMVRIHDGQIVSSIDNSPLIQGKFLFYIKERKDMEKKILKVFIILYKEFLENTHTSQEEMRNSPELMEKFFHDVIMKYFLMDNELFQNIKEYIMTHCFSPMELFHFQYEMYPKQFSFIGLAIKNARYLWN